MFPEVDRIDDVLNRIKEEVATVTKSDVLPYEPCQSLSGDCVERQEITTLSEFRI
jgi:hypothetical protein